MLRAPEAEALYEGYAQKGFGVFKPRWEPLSAGLKSHQQAHRDPEISVKEAEVPRYPQRCDSIPMDQEAKQPKTNE